MRLWLLPALLLLLLALLTSCASVGKRARGPRPQCPSHRCKCRWAGGHYAREDIRVTCLDLGGHIPNFTQTDVVYATVTLSRQKISAVPDDAFLQIQTRSLDLSDNLLGAPGCIAPRAFSGLEDTLEELILRANGLPSVPEQSLTMLPNLRKLNLEDNNITRINAHAFANNTQLRELYLYNNHIHQMDGAAFAGLSSLQNLILMGNNLQNLPTGVFSSLKKLASLVLSSNYLADLPKDTFRGLWHLKWLELQDNNLAVIHRRTFRGLRKLKWIKLDGNPLTSVGERSFNAIRKLRYLSFDIIHIEDLDPKIFKGLHKLKFLVLGDVNSSALPEGVFEPLRGLQYMTLFNRTGQFDSLSDNVFPLDMDLSSLSIWVTPLKSCKCNVSWLRGFTSRGVWMRGKCGKRLRDMSCLDKSLHRARKTSRRNKKNKHKD